MYNWPIIDNDLESAVLKQLHESLSDVNSTGILGDLENDICKYYDVPYSIFFSSATGAMHTLIYALNIEEKDNVIVPTYTFFATYSPFSYDGVEVRQVDSDEFGNLDPRQIESLIDKNTKAIVLTHMWGVSANMGEIMKVAEKHSLKVIEDCSHAHFGTHEGAKLGTIGDVGIFSTNQKALTSGEGGFLITREKSIFERSLSVAHYNKRLYNEVSNELLKKVALTGLGLKYRGHTLAAAILRDQLGKAQKIKQKRTEIYNKFKYAVEKSKLFTNILPDYKWTPGLYVFPFLCKDGREEFLEKSHKEGYFMFDAPGSTKPLYNEPLFNSGVDVYHKLKGKNLDRQFKTADQFHSQILKLPLIGFTVEEQATLEKYIEYIKQH